MKQNTIMNPSRKDKFMMAAFQAFNKEYGVDQPDFKINAYIDLAEMAYAHVTFTYNNVSIQSPYFGSNSKTDWRILHHKSNPYDNGYDEVTKREALLELVSDMPRLYLNKVQKAVLKFEELYDKYNEYIKENGYSENDIPDWIK